MPYIIDTPDWRNEMLSFSGSEVKYDYDYPKGLDLKPSSKLHNDIVSRLMRYSRDSSISISKRHSTWTKMDDKLQGYMPLSDAEKVVQEKDSRKPVSIIFPYTYAILETLVSYMVAAFFPEPMFRYEGMGPEDVSGALLLEKLINLHCSRNKIALNLHTMFRDSNAYGLGIVSPQWATKMGKKITKAPTGYAGPNGEVTQTGSQRIVEDAILFEGNELQNVDPYRYLPDPTVPIHDPQRGEFVGWLSTENYYDLLAEENMEGSTSFNTQYVQHMRNKFSTIFNPSTSSNVGNRWQSRSTELATSRNIVSSIDQLHMYVKLIPKEWNIGDSTSPEKYLFTVASDSILTRMQPLGLHHNMFPVCVAAPDFDGYSPVAYSRLEILSGMQTVVDWMFNAHITNVRKAINDVVIVDPYLINIKDLEDPGPGGIIRTRRPAWGRGVENAVKQLNIVDITARNMQDVSLIIGYMQQIMGTDNAVMGNLRQGGPERLTSAEYQGTSKGAVSRLERVAKIIGIQAMQDIGYMFAYHSQQLMTQETYIRSIGEWPLEVRKQLGEQNGRVKVSPDDILISYDILVRDGSIPGGNFSEANIKLFEIIAQDPVLRQQFDVVRYFEWIAANVGVKNASDFRVNAPQAMVGTAPDEKIAAQQQAGNLISMRSVMGG